MDAAEFERSLIVPLTEELYNWICDKAWAARRGPTWQILAMLEEAMKAEEKAAVGGR
jgi:hypothetical protein